MDTQAPSTKLAKSLNCLGKALDLAQPQVMGVLNVTPDSFSDGGQFRLKDAALTQAASMLEQGASIIDVGGESTRPGAQPVSVQQELDRVIPVVESVSARLDVIISVDTSTPEVMREAIKAGAGLVNDVRAFSRPGALAEIAKHDQVAACVMHMQGEPQSMQAKPDYTSVVDEIVDYLSGRVALLLARGFDRSQLIVDPGFGFGKTLEHNLTLLARLHLFNSLGCALLVGMSRKSMLGQITGRDVSDRQSASVAAALIAVQNGAHIVRVHDVKATVDALKVWSAVRPKMSV